MLPVSLHQLFTVDNLSTDIAVLAAVFAGWQGARTGSQARTARKAFNAQQQAQAEAISAWDTLTQVTFCNTSGAPAYHCIATLVNLRHESPKPVAKYRQEANRAYCDPLLPGERRLVTYKDHGGMFPGARFGVELAFTDNAGRHWLKPARGPLHRINESPLEHYGLTEPIDWRSGDDPEGFPSNEPCLPETWTDFESGSSPT
jgi:hypothetical protein